LKTLGRRSRSDRLRPKVTTEIAQGVAEVLAYGTAVVVEVNRS